MLSHSSRQTQEMERFASGQAKHRPHVNTSRNTNMHAFCFELSGRHHRLSTHWTPTLYMHLSSPSRTWQVLQDLTGEYAPHQGGEYGGGAYSDLWWPPCVRVNMQLVCRVNWFSGLPVMHGGEAINITTPWNNLFEEHFFFSFNSSSNLKYYCLLYTV